MANFNLIQSGANGILSYASGKGNYRAAVRVTDASYAFQLESTESKSRLYRAFYPHRRSLGSFTMTVECIGYKEYKNLQTWLNNYANALLSNAWSNAGGTTVINARLANRNFDKTGILVQGIEDGDHVGAMTYNVNLVFMTLQDGNDATTSILKSSQVSDFHSPAVDANASMAFYPVTASKYKDVELYDNLAASITPPAPPIPAPIPDPGTATNTGDKPIYVYNPITGKEDLVNGPPGPGMIIGGG